MMLTASEATTAVRNLAYPSSTEGTKESREIARLAYKAGVRTIEGRLAAYLANEYASNLSEGMQNSLWEDAMDESSGSYHDLESHYADFANDEV